MRLNLNVFKMADIQTLNVNGTAYDIVPNKLKSNKYITTQEDIDNFLSPNLFKYGCFKTNVQNDLGFGSYDGMILSIPWASGSDYGFQLAFDDTQDCKIKARGKSGSWGSWYTLWHTGNLTKVSQLTNDAGYKTTDTNTWRGITDSVSTTDSTISASATAVKTAYDKANHSHPYLPTAGGTMTGNITLGNGNAILGSGSSIPAKFLDSAAITPEVHSVWLAAVGTGSNGVGGAESAGILLDGNTIKMWAPLDNQPQIIDSDNGAAYTLYHSGNLTSLPASDVYSWAKAASKPSYTYSEVGAAPASHTHTKSQITDFPSSMPASDVYSWAKAASKPTYNFGEIGAGVATIGDGANRLMFRTNGSWASGMYYSTPGNEAHVFANVNAATSWIFATTNPTSQTAWTSLTPSMQIKNGRVVINKLIANDTYASYNLDVNGSANATELYEGGTRVSLAGHTHNYLPLSGGTMSGQLFIQYAKNGLTSIVKDSSSLIIGNVPNTAGFNGYHAGIGFNALCYSPYTDHTHAWIGLGPYTTTASAECYPLVFATNGSTTTGTSPTVRMTIAPDGKITMTNTCTAAGFYQSSDERLKTFYDPIKVDLDKLKKLRKNYFKFNDKDELEIGVSAQEIQQLYPELVSENSDGYLSIAYDKLSVIALKAIDELDNKYQKEINDLNDQLSTIKNILKEKGIL